METPLLLLPPPAPKRRRPNVTRNTVRVPVGHPLPLGSEVKVPFNLNVEVGIRWHPDWPEPRICVIARRFFPHGDCIGWTGDSANVWPVSDEVQALAMYHGKTLAESDEALPLLDKIGLDEPLEQEALAAFILPEQSGRSIH